MSVLLGKGPLRYEEVVRLIKYASERGIDPEGNILVPLYSAIEKYNTPDDQIEKAEKKRVKCAVCLKLIKTKKFKVVWVFNTDRVDKFYHESMTDVEKEIVVCNKCISNLNFREYK